MRKLLLAIILFCPTGALAQGYRIDNVVLNSRGQPVPNPTVTVCTSAGTGLPCAPLATVYTSAALTTTAANPLPIVAGLLSGATGADAQGNYGFWVPPATTYIITVTSPQISPGYSYAVVAPPTASGNNIFTGTATFKNLNNIRFADQFSGADWVAKLNAADSDLGATAGTIYVSSAAAGSAATILNLSATGIRQIIFDAGTFATSGTLSHTKQVRWVGAGQRLTIIQTSSATADVISFASGADGSAVENLSIDASVTRTAGSGLNVAASFTRVEGVRFTNQFNDISLTGNATGFTLRHFEFRNSSNHGLNINSTGNDFFVSDGIADNSPPSSGNGVNFIQGSGLWMTDVDFIHFNEGLSIAPGTSITTSFLFCKACIFDTNTDNGITLTGTGNIDLIEFVDSWAASSVGASGVFLNNSNINGFSWLGGFLINNKNHGLNLAVAGATNIRVEGATISGNSAGSAGTFHGLTTIPGATGFQFIGNRSGPVGGQANTQGWGIIVNAGASDNYTIANNDLRGNVTGGLSDGGTGVNKQVSGNLPLGVGWSFPTGTDTVVGLAATQTLTNKTLSTGTVFSAGLFNSAGTLQTAWHMVQDVATLSAGAVTVTLTGSAVFTSATTYACIAEDETAANATKCVRNSGSSLTISGTATDVVHFVLIGN